jgi:hypothetical protein
VVVGNGRAKGTARTLRSAPFNDKKNKHRCQLGWSSHPQDHFTAVVSVFQAHLPMHRYIDSDAKPLDWKSQGEESDNTDPLASHRKIDSLDSYSASCNRLRGY